MQEMSPRLPGTMSVLLVFASCEKASTYFSATLQVDGVHAAFGLRGGGNAAKGLGRCRGKGERGGRLAFGLVDLGLLFTLGLGDGGLAGAGGEVDLLELAAFGCGDDGALFALGRDLLLHGLQDDGGRRQVLDLVAEHLDAPVEGRLVNRGDDGLVDEIALLEGLVELHPADDGAKRRLGELRDGDDVVGRAVGGALRVGHLEEEDAVDRELGIVARDATWLGVSTGSS